MDKLVFIDIETTGLNVRDNYPTPDRPADRIIEIAAAVYDPHKELVEKTYATLVWPYGIEGLHWRWQANRFDPEGDDEQHWILDDFNQKRFDSVDWCEAKSLHEALVGLSDFLEGNTPAGNNPHFDLEFLLRDYEFCGLPLPKMDYHRIDVASPSIFPVLAGQTPGISLRNTWLWAGKTGAQEHRAMSDVLDSITVFEKLKHVFDAGLRALAQP